MAKVLLSDKPDGNGFYPLMAEVQVRRKERGGILVLLTMPVKCMIHGKTPMTKVKWLVEDFLFRYLRSKMKSNTVPAEEQKMKVFFKAKGEESPNKQTLYVTPHHCYKK